MEDLKVLKSEIDKALDKLKIDKNTKRLEGLKAQSTKPDFWQDNLSAQSVMREISRLELAIGPWVELNQSLKDTEDLYKLKDETMSGELKKQVDKLKQDFNGLKKQLKFNGKYDDHDVFMSIYAGAGGTDAQDWAEMLYRMYAKWAEANGYEVNLIEQSQGEEAGLKSITVEINGSFIYGKLKGEHGVHRLVRLSPFNTDNLRQTSFAKVDVLPKVDQPDEVDLDEKDIKTDVFRSGGKGGQSVNTTDSAVRVTHMPSGISVVIQNERSQLQNKDLALNILRSKLTQLQIDQHAQKLSQLKGPNTSAEWGHQIRSYVLHPYKQVKDLRTGFKSNDTEKILNGYIDDLIDSYLDKEIGIVS